MNNDGFFDKLDEGAQTLKDRVQRFAAEYAPYIMLVGMIIFEVLARLFTVEITTFFTPEFWSTLFINTLSSTLSFACFVFYAERKRKESASYQENLRTWGLASQRVRSSCFDDFLAYCKESYRQECEDRRTSLISNFTQISLERWAEYRTKTNKEIRELAKKGVITWREAYIVNKAKKHPRLKPINPLLILAGMKATNINSAGRSNASSLLSVLTRPIPTLSMSIAFSMFAGSYLGTSDSSVLFDMLYTAGMIVMSSCMGYIKGCDNADRKHGEIKVRIMFIERYEKQHTQA